MPIPLLTVLYCEASDVAQRLSEVAVELHTDDLAVPSIDDCLREATADINFWLGAAYKPQFLAANAWVGYCCRAIATYYTCIRRGNDPPASVTSEYEKYMEMLKLVASGEHKLPQVPTSPGGMAISNQTYDNNRYPGLVVERPRSMPTDRLPPRRYDPNADRIQGGGLTGG